MDDDRPRTPARPPIVISSAGEWIDWTPAPGYDRRALHGARDEYGNSLIGKWIPDDLTLEGWEQIKGATLAGDLGIGAKVLDDWTTACVYTRDYRDTADLRRVVQELRRLGCDGLINYKRDAETSRGIYGRGDSYWYSPGGTAEVVEPAVCRGRELDAKTAAKA